MEPIRVVFVLLAVFVLTLAAPTQGWAQETVEPWRCSNPLQNISLVTQETPATENILSTKIDIYPHELFRPVLTFVSSHTIYKSQFQTEKTYLTYELSYALEPDVVVETYIPETDTYTADIKPAPTYTTLVSCEEVEAGIAVQ